MSNDLVSIIIPSRNEVHTIKTVQEVIAKAEGDVECLVIIDGWDIEPLAGKVDQVLADVHKKIIDDLLAMAYMNSQIKICLTSTFEGQRLSINRAAKAASGKYMFKLDAHCKISKGWDIELKRIVQDDTFITVGMRGLDVDKWTANDRVYDFALINSELTWRWWSNYNVNYASDKPVIAETMAFPGTVWFLTFDLWWKLGGYDERLSAWGETGTEFAFKVWLSGNRMLIHRGVCVAHWFRKHWVYRNTGGPRKATQRQLCSDLKDGLFPGQIHSIDWLVGKFWPVPSWEGGTLSI